MQKAVLTPLMLILAGLLLAAPAAAAQDQAFEHSTNAQAALERYNTGLGQHAEVYHQQVSVAGDRFSSLCERHVQRYTSQLERLVRELTQDGNFEAAQQVQAMIATAGEWQVTAPDAEGRHFLSTENLELTLSEAGTQHGVDMLVLVERAGVLYQEQLASILDVYGFGVETEQREYNAALNRVLAAEQRAGRLDAVQEVRDAIQALADAPDEIVPPGAPQGTDDARDNDRNNDEGDGSFAGYYMLEYREDGRTRCHFLVELTEEGGFVHGQSWQVEFNRWHKVSWPIEIVSNDGEKLVIRHDRNRGDEMAIHEIELEDGRPDDAALWWTEEDFEAREGTLEGRITALGSPGADLLGLRDGDYVFDMQFAADPRRGREAHRMRFRIEINNGIVAMTQQQTNDEGWTNREPNVLQVETDDEELLLTFDPRGGEGFGVIRVDASGNGAPLVEYWWDARGYHRGRAPGLTGAMLRP